MVMFVVQSRKAIVLFGSSAVAILAVVAIASGSIIKYFNYINKLKKVPLVDSTEIKGKMTPEDLVLLEVQGLLSSSREVLDAETKLYIAEQRLDAHRTAGDPQTDRWQVLTEAKRREADEYLTQYCSRLSRITLLDPAAVKELLQKAVADSQDPRESAAFGIAQNNILNYKKDNPRLRDSIRSEFRSVRNR